MVGLVPYVLSATRRPTPAQREQVQQLVQRAAAVDGHVAVNEAGLLALRTAETADRAGQETGGGAGAVGRGHPDPVHVLASGADDGPLLGYAQAVGEDGGPVAAVVVDPEHRRRGIGTALWHALTTEVAGTLRVWASKDSAAARGLAARLGLREVRTLLVLGRSLDGELPSPEPPAGIAIRPFRPETDEEAWLSVNGRAFASHPEQGSMTAADLHQRLAEPWFDPAGFLVAEDATTGGSHRLAGFHWTKREPGSDTGEVYVIAVDPDAGVRGLGTALLGAGLAHLREVGAHDVDLYVEADNARALALYRRHGFAPISADVMYAAPPPPAPAAPQQGSH